MYTYIYIYIYVCVTLHMCVTLQRGTVELRLLLSLERWGGSVGLRPLLLLHSEGYGPGY